MAFKLSKKEDAEREVLAAKLENAAQELEQKIADFNRMLWESNSILQEAIDAYNDVLDQAQSFVEEISEAAENEHAEKSESWQESDRGQAAYEWVEEWRNVELDYVIIDMPDELSLHIEDNASILRDLPNQAGS